MQTEKMLKSLLRDVPDFPKPGIIFKDITPLLADPLARQQVVNSIVENYRSLQIDAIAAVEARGFIFGSLLAGALELPFIPVRKSGKLPYKKISQNYSLEYGTASLEIHEDAIKPGWRVLIHDDLLATGGTSSATAAMIQELDGKIGGFSFIINLSSLPGEKYLAERFLIEPHYLISYP
jgi:adenine phosphoribosyltransferase